jgi:hypothetical protein
MTAEVAEYSVEDKAEAYDRMMAEQAEAKKAQAGPERFKVVVSDPNAMERTLFSSVSKKRARAWVEQHVPRGQHERHSGGPQGEDIEAWQEFDRDAYSSPELNPVNTNDPWADAWEGAQ